MPRLRPFWRRHERLADWLPWLLPLDDARETILTAAGGLLRVVKIEPPDFETASPEELVAHHARIGAGPARFGNGWSFWFDQWRTAAPGYLEPCPFGGCLAAQLVDESRRRHFTDTARPVFRNSAFLAVHYLPQRRDALAAWLMDRANSQVAANVAFFLENSDSLFQELAHALRAVTVLRGDELSSYLSACVTFEPKRTQFPTGVLADQLASREWRTTPSLAIDGRHLATVEIRNFGSPSPLTVEALHELPFPCRWVVAMHGLGPDERRQEILEVRKRWLTRQKGLGAILTEIVTRNPFAGRTDPEADRALAQLDVMQGELAERPYALAHGNVHVWADSQDAGARAGSAGGEPAQRPGARGTAGHPQQHLRPARRHARQRHPGGDERTPGTSGDRRHHAPRPGHRRQRRQPHRLAVRRQRPPGRHHAQGHPLLLVAQRPGQQFRPHRDRRVPPARASPC